MMRQIKFAVGLVAMWVASFSAVHAQSSTEHAHVTQSFSFEVNAPMAKVAPLFAPEAERNWGDKDWNPVFLYPTPGRDVEGAVWTMQHGSHNSVWVNTLFDVAGGRMQYVVFVGEHLVTTIDVRVKALSATRTGVDVTYTHTAVDPAANEYVAHLGEVDKTRGPEWQKGVEHALGMKSGE